MSSRGFRRVQFLKTTFVPGFVLTVRVLQFVRSLVHICEKTFLLPKSGRGHDHSQDIWSGITANGVKVKLGGRVSVEDPAVRS